ncbi:MAG: MoaD/ThiS family protein [Candidatus Bathyarchaeia archaeon]|nr:MoaD/ThiS family protein [Candidatus Bathyarchaeota archaeon]
MAKVKVKYFGRLRELLSVKEEDYNVDGATLADLLLKHIPERHRDKSQEWKETIFVTVRGEVALNTAGTPMLKNYFILVKGRTPKLTYRLEDGDEVAILPPVGGGTNES